MNQLETHTALEIAPYYEWKRELGSGGMGRVVLAWDTRLERYVAIKYLYGQTPGQQTVFLQEARAIARLVHPNIVSIFDIGEAAGQPYMVMEYLSGRTLEQMIADTPRIPISLCAAVGVQLCAALDFAHQRGVIHRDVKPANVMLLRNGSVKLMDFGIVHCRGAGLEECAAAGVAVGTLKYAAPEQLLDAGQVVPASDVYSLGVLLFELLAGEHPFEAPSVAEFVRRMMSGDVPRIRDYYWDIPEAFERVLQRAMAKAPEDRFQQAAEMADALSQLVDNSSLQRVLAGSLLNLGQAVEPAGSRRETTGCQAMRSDLRLIPEVGLALNRLRHDLQWLEQTLGAGSFKETAHLPKDRLTERILSSNFSGLVQMNQTIWGLVQNGYFLDFVSPSLTPRIDKTGDELFEILPRELETVRLYAATQGCLPLLLVNLLQIGRLNNAPELKTWPELLEKLPDASGCLICKTAETQYCFGYFHGEQVFRLELHATAAPRIGQIGLSELLEGSHLIWDFYPAEFSPSPINARVLLTRTVGSLAAPTQQRLRDQRPTSSLSDAERAERFGLSDVAHRLEIQKPEIQLFDRSIRIEVLLEEALLCRFMSFFLLELIPQLLRGGQAGRFAALVACGESLAEWRFHQRLTAEWEICGYDAAGRLRLCVRQGDGEAGGMEIWMADLQKMANPDLQAAFYLSPAAYLLEDLAWFARQTRTLHQGPESLPAVPLFARQVCQLGLIEYDRDEKKFRLSAPSVYG